VQCLIRALKFRSIVAEDRVDFTMSTMHVIEDYFGPVFGSEN